MTFFLGHFFDRPMVADLQDQKESSKTA